jgi:hypothetical protein
MGLACLQHSAPMALTITTLCTSVFPVAKGALPAQMRLNVSSAMLTSPLPLSKTGLVLNTIARKESSLVQAACLVNRVLLTAPLAKLTAIIALVVLLELA